jgi:hypothetical protein
MLATNVQEIWLIPADVQRFDPQTMLSGNSTATPARVRLHIETSDDGVDQLLWTR